ncbi:esterase family protein [Psychrosphaera sp. B3R10]|uniref:alpha/beta hydrolase n=1 Tax=unclassified Psychrosphaera TaxID=2641570 RepID=UPI001C085DCC|nr:MULTISPECIES: alpha/beta hydrolase-fold protein [unclassified Psychrosphaera]MBU2883856.1 esterase family protein [Psychrosphaera sp. I2R16]MBU2988719.1 esterase family protein [Psychrosphaera sp. B3R10]
MERNSFIWFSALMLLLLSSCLFAKPMTVSSGTLIQDKVMSFDAIAPRTINVWLPDGYDINKTYDVLYMHDGDMLFDATTTWNNQEWQVDEVVSKLIAEHRVRPFIVVGIPNGGLQRAVEYFPKVPLNQMNNLQKTELIKGLPLPENKPFIVTSDEYLAFLVTKVIPYVESTFSVNRGGKHRYLAGSSMGALISWYGLMQYPDEFAGAICMSTHWVGLKSDNGVAFKQFYNYIASNLSKLKDHKLYFDYGNQTLDVKYPKYQQQIDALFTTRQYPKEQWQSLLFDGHDHTERSWQSRLHVPLAFMFGH